MNWEIVVLGTEGIHFTFGGETYTQVDGVVVVSPIGPVVAVRFMVEVNRNVIAVLKDSLSCRKRYVDAFYFFRMD